jgi:hypothetical protein
VEDVRNRDVATRMRCSQVSKIVCVLFGPRVVICFANSVMAFVYVAALAVDWRVKL